MSNKYIQIRGAHEHNLKMIDIDIPRESFVVVTGLSGSGKSSLAFDTIYAEGQRKYVESLSTYARQFLDIAQKPKVESISGLSPTIAIEQRKSSHNPRSTVATTTEIYDYCRVLFARAGIPHCWKCNKPISSQSATQIVDSVLELPEGTRIQICSPLIRGAKGEHKDALARIRREGFVRVRLDGSIYDLKKVPAMEKNKKHSLEAVVDRLVMKESIRSRLADSVETALKFGDGSVIVMVQKKNEDGSYGKWQDHLYSEKFACADHPEVSLDEVSPRLFSFNSPYGACDECDGLGIVLEFDPDLVVPDKSVSIQDGAIDAWRKSGRQLNMYYAKMIRQFCRHFDVSPTSPFSKLTEEKKRILMQGTSQAVQDKYGWSFEGVIPNLQRRWENTTSEYVKTRLHGYLSERPCRKCGGARLRMEALQVTIGGKNISELTSMSITDAFDFFNQLKLDEEKTYIAAEPLKEIRARLKFLLDVGLGYLTLARASATLSGGEAQRIRLATQVGSGLVGCCYVLDEPTIGLHRRDNDRLNSILRKLADIGNTVLVVEHDEDVIDNADHIIDIGPAAGTYGGKLIAQGTLDDIKNAEQSITGQYLSGQLSIRLPEKRRKKKKTKQVEVRGASENNLKNINVKFPLGVFTCVTGVSGSGKSTLVSQVLLKAVKRKLYRSRDIPGRHKNVVGTGNIDKIIEINQSPIGRTPRSNPATYTGVFDLIRQVFAQTREARIRGYKPGRFSFNVKGGRCEYCQGQGTKKIEMHFLPDVFVTCQHCKGKRYNPETLEVRYKGKNISDVLEMQIDDAKKFFENFPKISRLLQSLCNVGLGYVKLGQSSTTLSGGEAQRVKLASELGRPATGHTLYILDEPTTGLHFADISNLLKVLQTLTDMGNSVVVIEHNLDVVKMADHIIDLGPEGGDQGGEIVAAGTPEEVAESGKGYTAKYLKERLAYHKQEAGAV
ncbi:Excinuclease ABC subunit A [Sedimentisphaera cyanobacteriorum]|uniref:UvrABC system protein A n=1 Tax=Sedimentisphaera cyanobacteriorum TaxID=1940790 RepID=A0A1Q2HQI7_9BACT|nr:excinuclease ABC subunit UvrA [Sedimentisphaera cyanobacteriorum]AQQ09544.1 Excinuclease ABC subunit A [Sedimentisphaera cyanobacteriorum]